MAMNKGKVNEISGYAPVGCSKNLVHRNIDHMQAPAEYIVGYCGEKNVEPRLNPLKLGRSESLLVDHDFSQSLLLPATGMFNLKSSRHQDFYVGLRHEVDIQVV